MESRHICGILCVLFTAIAISQPVIAISASDWTDKGNVFYNQRNYINAIDAYDNAIAIDPSYSDAWYNKGDALGAQGKYVEAIQCYDKAIELNPNDARPWHGKGVSLCFLNRCSEAIQCYDKAIELDPTNARIWDGKASVYYDLGNYTGSVECFDKALQINPGDSFALQNRPRAVAKLNADVTATPLNPLMTLVALAFGAISLVASRKRG